MTTAQSLVPNDSATISGGYNHTGSITFSLFGPSDTTCGGTPALTQTVSVSSGTATYGTTNTTFIASTAGTWRWLVTYTGDTNNNGFTIACGTERFAITDRE